MKDIKAEGAKYDDLLKYVWFSFLSTSSVYVDSCLKGLSASRRNSGASTQEGASPAEKIKRVCNVLFVKLPTKQKTWFVFPKC